jgi:hypothetical protein
VTRFYDPAFVYSGKKNNFLDVEAANQDLSSAEYQYFGYISPRDGKWIIQRFHIISSCIIYEYAQGRTIAAYASAWNASGQYIGNFTFARIDLATPLP